MTTEDTRKECSKCPYLMFGPICTKCGWVDPEYVNTDPCSGDVVCEGLGGHRGPLRYVVVLDAPFGPSMERYCETAIEEDRKRGFHLLVNQGPPWRVGDLMYFVLGPHLYTLRVDEVNGNGIAVRSSIYQEGDADAS